MSTALAVFDSHLAPPCATCSSLAAGSESHKNLKDEWPILRFYYTAPYALFWVCAFNETFLGSSS